ncbi:MAG: thioredoxin domain-containing protein [Pseudomonadota bacterium]
MRIVLTAISAALMAACGQAQTGAATEQTAVTAPSEDTKIMAVMSYADWCSSCKALDPKVKAVEAANTFKGVEFATLDFTGRDADAFFADAETLGVGPSMRAEFGDKIKTGKLYLVSLDTGDVISTIDKSMDEAAITAAITEAIALS